MSRSFNFFFLFAVLGLWTSCGTTKKVAKTDYAEIVEEGFLDCYEKGLLTEKGNPFWCETSAVLYSEGNLLLANDHQMPDGRSAVFSLDFDETTMNVSQKPEYSDHFLLKIGSKYEDFAFSPDGKTVFLITGFDRIREDGSSDWDGYNGFYYWPTGKMDEVRVVSKTGTDNTSISIRSEIAKAMADEAFPEAMPYFKTEALSVLEDKVLLGVREYGKNYSDFSYSAKLISVSYDFQDDLFYLKDDFEIFADLKPNELEPSLEEVVALSSMEYDPKDKKFYLLTSFEDDKNGIGAYLWTATYKELQHNKMNLVRTQEGNPLKFNHKAEDLTFLSDGRLFVIHDDDKEVTQIKNQKRQPHQAAYSIVKLK